MAARKFDVMSLGQAGLLDPAQMGYKDSLEIIKDESVKLKKSFVKIGWYLKHIRDNELFKEDGYANINECAADKLGYSQPTVSRFIKICEKFSKDHNSPELDTKYAGFDKSQMIEMLPMEPEQLEKVTPDMTVSEIRAIKKDKTKTVERETEDDLPGQTNIEEDFPEYLPESDIPKVSGSEREEYAESYKDSDLNAQSEDLAGSEDCDRKDIIIDGTYREINEGKEEAKPEAQTQAELPLLKNNDQRHEWLKNYKEWGLWYRDENIDVNYYKYDFSDGSRLIVAEYPQRYCYWNGKVEDESWYHLLEKNKQGYKNNYDEVYRNATDSETYLVEFLKRLQKKG